MSYRSEFLNPCFFSEAKKGRTLIAAFILFDIKTKKKIVSYNAQSLLINVYSDELVISLKSLEIDENLKIDCDLFVLFQLCKKE